MRDGGNGSGTGTVGGERPGAAIVVVDVVGVGVDDVGGIAGEEATMAGKYIPLSRSVGGTDSCCPSFAGGLDAVVGSSPSLTSMLNKLSKSSGDNPFNSSLSPIVGACISPAFINKSPASYRASSPSGT